MSRLIFLALPVALSMMAHPVIAFIPPARMYQSALLMDNTIYVHGGDDPAGNIVSNMYALDVSQSWPCTSPAWADRTSDAGTFSVPGTEFKPMWSSADGKSFYIWGGSSDPSVKLPQNGFAQYNVVTKSWSFPSYISNMPQQRSDVTVGLASTGIAYFWGGWGTYYTGYFSVRSSKHIFDSMFTFDTTKLVWNVLQITGNTPVPRIAHTATMLSNDQMVIIGGLTGVQINDTYVKQTQVSMSDVPVFDTKTATWTMRSATGNIPNSRRYHNAVLTIGSFRYRRHLHNHLLRWNDIRYGQLQRHRRAQHPDLVVDTAAHRRGCAGGKTRVIIGHGMGNSLNGLNDVNILDTRKTPFQWTSSFTSSFTSSPDGLIAVGGVGGIGGVIGISIAVLIIAILIFLVVRKPWRKTKAPHQTREIQPVNQHNPSPEPNRFPTDQYNPYNAEPNRPPLETHQTQMTNLYSANSGPPADQFNSYVKAMSLPHTHQMQPNNQHNPYADPNRPSTDQYNPYPESYKPMYQTQFNSQHNPCANPNGPPMPIKQRVENSQPVSEIVYSKPDTSLSIGETVYNKPDVKD
ncbi:hypothetical protein BC938DRAFT_480822 [Jimgerdemannia flammicorona]|uniref:Galactose oxidase n=1 Tax=Jimgerdemannia flammicorona TaxID=994334 RepID=A0A433QXC9_9FUNG|nr:hypothetical protein BC938DRAFT_480822 [Jimgerdemannia flammicorona]